MHKIVFDIETKNTFQEVGSTECSALDMSVVCIYDSKEDSYRCFEERDLNSLWPILEKADLLIGFNSEHFDIPILNKYYHGDLTKIRSLDILKEIKNTTGRRMKLDQIAEGTLGINKSGHGLQAITWWKKGEIDTIKKYCEDDVKITKELYEFAIKNGYLKYKEGPTVFTIKLDTSNWEKPAIDDSSLTFSMPF